MLFALSEVKLHIQRIQKKKKKKWNAKQTCYFYGYKEIQSYVNMEWNTPYSGEGNDRAQVYFLEALYAVWWQISKN